LTSDHSVLTTTIMVMMMVTGIRCALASRRLNLIWSGMPCVSRSADEDDEGWRSIPPAAQGATMLDSISWVAKRLLSDNIVCPAHLI
jgi:hypothetical protein